ncbi:MAG: hypothetical protein IJJ44_06530 [Solobacterium sp.]|nr:hypothetical protein [Solobacterium sp.]
MEEKEIAYEHVLMQKCRELEKECEAMRLVVLHNDKKCHRMMTMIQLMVVVLAVLMFLVYSCTYRMSMWGMW